jgi:hypothetical protein
MIEKSTEQLQLRMPSSLFLALSRLATAEDRSMSEYCRMVLSLHAFGHVHRLEQSTAACEECNALSETARK